MPQSPPDHVEMVLLRHGHAHRADPSQRYYTGPTEPLTELGERQAGVAAELLEPFGIRRIVGSDLERAAQTARIVGRRLQIEPTFHPELREVDCGLTDGCTEAEIRQRFPDHTGLVDVGFMAGFPTGENHVPAELAYPQGESICDVARRAIPFFSALCRDGISSGTTTLVVAHAWVLTTLLCHVIEAPVASYYRFYLENTAFAHLRADRQGRGVLHGLNSWPWDSAGPLGSPLLGGDATSNATSSALRRPGNRPPVHQRDGGSARCR